MYDITLFFIMHICFQTLVDINDKPAKIVGSKTWIGSTEVGFVLETYLGVSFALNVSYYVYITN